MKCRGILIISLGLILPLLNVISFDCIASESTEQTQFFGKYFSASYPLGAKAIDIYDDSLVYKFTESDFSSPADVRVVEVTGGKLEDKDNQTETGYETDIIKKVIISNVSSIVFQGKNINRADIVGDCNGVTCRGERVTFSRNGYYFGISYYSSRVNDSWLYDRYNQVANSVIFRDGSHTAKSNVARKIVVDSNGFGDYSSLAEAVFYAAPGSSILLKSGTYHVPQTIYIDKDLTLTGEEKEHVKIIFAGDFDGLRIIEGARQVAISNLTFSYPEKGDDKHLKTILSVAEVDLSITDCRFVNSQCSAIFIENQKSKCAITRCYFSDHPCNAIAFHHAEGTIRNNRIVNNGLAAIEAKHSRNLIIEDNEIVGSGGIYVATEGFYVIRRNTISNATRGIFADVAARFRIEDNKIRSIEDIGIIIKSFSKGVVRNNSVTDAKHGVLIYDSSYAFIDNNDLSGNKGRGIVVEMDSFAHIRKNKISGNAIDGISVFDFSKVHVAENSIMQNKEDGLFLNETSYGLVENNKIYFNRSNGILLEGTSTAYMGSNFINNNESSDLSAKLDSHFYSNNPESIRGKIVLEGNSTAQSYTGMNAEVSVVYETFAIANQKPDTGDKLVQYSSNGRKKRGTLLRQVFNLQTDLIIKKSCNNGFYECVYSTNDLALLQKALQYKYASTKKKEESNEKEYAAIIEIYNQNYRLYAITRKHHITYNY